MKMDLSKPIWIIQIRNMLLASKTNTILNQLEFMMNQLFYIINSIISDQKKKKQFIDYDKLLN